ncbi:hypothetical protein [Brevibacillus laterosporus]|uniref:Phage tail protein n=1 Tax=Brevibacillus laterosporus TaxID=1465 RepID=A0AAP3DGF0_BRELA|nr:hypothetical protein [Brevibacillus laterosporus]MCR8979475.1 hypothetical protein [Brevibacillus laterosporus]MCZ0806630.1 hypothetical protein [Brevibacillus laterosporus]MCZ0825078.1 hypothetical protein [Brevibacillus laterosporus]MCZ0852084.1 hypothetical protein [Brevibacillus laterosporus]
MAQAGLLGKKLVIAVTDSNGNVLKKSPEILKWSEEEITTEDKKHPIGEETEYRRNTIDGWKGSFSGQDTNGAYDDIVDARLKYQKETGDTLSFSIFTTRIYKDGTVKKYKFTDVTFDGYKADVDGGNKAINNSINWHATERIPL